MSDHTDILADVLALAEVEQQGWKARTDAILASGVPVNIDQLGYTFPNPFGGSVDGAGVITVDDYTADITRMPEIVRAFARNNQGYWIEDVFNSPGWTVNGGAVAYTISSTDDYFLAAGKEPAPRSPGSEAPVLGGTRRARLLAEPENLSGRLPVTDEARQDNDLMTVNRTFQQTANTFARIMQTIGEDALSNLIQTQNRFLALGNNTFAEWDESPLVTNNTTNTPPFPGREFARVRTQFVKDLGGVVPDSLMWSADDAELFDNIYGERGDQVLARYGITNTYTSTRLTTGNRRYFKKGQVGTLAWAKPMDTEQVREGLRKTDTYVMDGRFVFIANGADAILEVRDTSGGS